MISENDLSDKNKKRLVTINTRDLDQSEEEIFTVKRRFNLVDDVQIEALGEISDDLKRIDVSVSYNNNEHVYRFRTYRFQRN